MSQTDYDAIIVGAGPAGLTAGIYLARAGKKTLCLEQAMPGGQILTAGKVENYPGFVEPISGQALIEAMEGQARRHGLDIQIGRVDKITVDGEVKTVDVGGFPFTAKVVILATGLIQKLGIPGEEDYLGRGVSYCATCDAALCRGHEIASIALGEHSLEETLFLAGFAAKVYLVTKAKGIEPTTETREALIAAENVEIIPQATPLAIPGDMRGITGLVYRDGAGEERTLENLHSVFILSGKRIPGTAPVEGLVDLAEGGFAMAGETCETKVPGLYAIGDVRRRKFHQVGTAVGDGTIAGMDALKYLRSK